jgi:thiosulfate dehydrogenase
MKPLIAFFILIIAAASLAGGDHARADEFTKKDLTRWQAEYESSVKYGRTLWLNAAKIKLGTNGLACVQCHPNGANTHPETYPKFQKQLGKVAAFWEMINWCIKNPLQGKALAADSKEMIALQAYAASERKGVALSPGKH